MRHPLASIMAAVLLMPVVVSPLRAATPPSGTPKDTAKWRLATLAAAREILNYTDHPEALADAERILLIERLNDAMRQDVAAHSSREESRARCADLVISFQRDTLEQRFNAITAHATEQSPFPVSRGDIAAYLGSTWSNRLEKALRNSAQNEIPVLFKAARARAVGLLRQEVEQELRFPNEAEADTLLTALAASHPETRHLTAGDIKVLQNKLLSLLHPGNKPLFEELESTVASRTQRLAAELARQFEHQMTLRDETAAQDIPANQREAPLIASTLTASLNHRLDAERARSRLTDESGNTFPVYPPFSPIRNSFPALAVELETSRFKSFIVQTPTLSLDAETLIPSMIATPEKHHTQADSHSFFENTLSEERRRAAITDYASGAMPGGRDLYFSTLASTNPVLVGTFKERLSGELHSRLPDARKTVSEAQFEKYFRELTRETALTSEALAQLQDSGGRTLTNLTDALRLLDHPARDENILLEETLQRVLEAANRKAHEGHEVITAQLSLLRQLETRQFEQLRKDVAARRSIREIRKEWEAELETAWKGDSRSRSTPYGALLDPTLSALNKTVRQLYDTLQDNPRAVMAAPPIAGQAGTEPDKGTAKTTQQEPARPEDQNKDPQSAKNKATPDADHASDQSSGQEAAAKAVLSRLAMDRKNAPDGVLILTQLDNGNAVARLISLAENQAYEATYAPSKPQEAAKALFETLKPHLEIIWKTTLDEWREAHSGLGFLKRKTPPKLKMLVVIQSDEVRHRMSLLLREQIEQAFAEWHAAQKKDTPPVELDWKVGLTFDFEPGSKR